MTMQPLASRSDDGMATGVGERTRRAMELGSASALAEAARDGDDAGCDGRPSDFGGGSSGGDEDGLREQQFSVLYLY
jgi:hypothetical protein